MSKDEQYSSVAKSFHWTSAILIIFLLALGLYMVDLQFSDLKMELYSLHKSLGFIVLALIVIRVFWAATNEYPNHHPNHQKWERALAKVAHIALYALSFLMPFSGILMSQSYGYPVSLFGIFEIPTLVEKNVVHGENLALIHQYSAYALIAIIGLHVAGALKHHFVDKDSTLRRMLPFSK